MSQAMKQIHSQMPQQQAFDSNLIESVLIKGDLEKLSSQERTAYYGKVCKSLGLNPYTKPFNYIRLNGKLTLYACKDATDQLRKIHKISINIVSREKLEDIYLVIARATDKLGRTDEAIGAVALANAKGDTLANLLMKCESKAKRRVTLSICGLGWCDELETETIPNSELVNVSSSGEILEDKQLTVEELPASNTAIKTSVEESRIIKLLSRFMQLLNEAVSIGCGVEDMEALDLDSYSEVELIELGKTLRKRIDSFKQEQNNASTVSY